MYVQKATLKSSLISAGLGGRVHHKQLCMTALTRVLETWIRRAKGILQAVNEVRGHFRGRGKARKLPRFTSPRG